MFIYPTVSNPSRPHAVLLRRLSLALFFALACTVALPLQAQKLKDKEVKTKLTRKARKKGRSNFLGNYVGKDGKAIHSVYLYSNKRRKGPFFYDVSTFDAQGKFLGVKTYPRETTDLIETLELDPGLYADALDYFLERQANPFGPGPAVQFGGNVNLYARSGRVALFNKGVGGTTLDYDDSGKKEYILGKSTVKLVPTQTFVNPYASSLLPWYDQITNRNERGRFGRYAGETYAMVRQGEPVLIGGIVSARLKLGADYAESEDKLGRFYTCVYSTERMEASKERYHETGFEFLSFLRREYQQSGETEIYAGIKEEGELFGIAYLKFSGEGELLEKRKVASGLMRLPDDDSDFFEYKGDQIAMIGTARLTQKDQKRKDARSQESDTRKGGPQAAAADPVDKNRDILSIIRMGEKNWSTTLDLQSLYDAFGHAPNEKDKMMVERKKRTVLNFLDLQAADNGDVVVSGYLEVASGLTSGKRRPFAVQFSAEDGALKGYYELDRLKPKDAVDYIEPHTVYHDGKAYLLFRAQDPEKKMAMGTYRSSTGNVTTTWVIDEPFSYGKLVVIDLENKSLSESLDIKKRIIRGFKPMVVTREGVVLIDLVKHFTPFKRKSERKLVVR